MYIILRIEHLIKLTLIMGLLRLQKLWYFCYCCRYWEMLQFYIKKKFQIGFRGGNSII